MEIHAQNVHDARYLNPKYSMWISTAPALGEYIPKAPVNEEVKRYNQNLPGMGGVFNTVNFNLYHYSSNNPVKYVDPNGEWVLNIGVFGSAGAGVGGSVSGGFSIGYSKEKGVTFGVFTSESIGAEFSADASAGISVSLDVFSDGVESGTSRTMTIGGSADIGVSVGSDLTIDIDSKDVDVSIGVSKSKGTGGNIGAGVKIGIGASATAGEAHVRYNSTQTKATSLNEVLDKAAQKMSNLENAIKDYCIEKTLEIYRY